LRWSALVNIHSKEHEMQINHRSIALGLTVGLFAGGAAGALAATTAGSSTTAASATTSWSGDGGPGGYGYGPGWSADSGDQIHNWYGDGGPVTIGRTAISAAARYLALTPSELTSRLGSGNTLAQLASSEHKSVSGLEDAIVAAISRSVHTERALSAGQKAAIITNADRWIGSIVDTACPMGNVSGFGVW
jgi:hypothetical protein